MTSSAAAQVFSAQEIARAAGVSPDEARRLLATGGVRTLDSGFVPQGEAVRAVRLLRGSVVSVGGRGLFAPSAPSARSAGRGLIGSAALHAGVLAVLVVVTSLGVDSEVLEQSISKPARLVFLATKGPGGGGGGGGLRQRIPAPRAQMKGPSALKSPVPPPRPITARKPDPKVERPLTPPVRPAPVPKPAEPPPPPPKTEPLPQVVAPVVASAADPRDRAGVLDSATESSSNGAGSGGGAGTGQGTGMGEGDGAGIGPGSGGGTGGGPYRPGSGITPPSLLREVKPDYTPEARRRGTEGEVVLEIVVRRDGTVGEAKLVQGLGAGLDQRAIDAVRQWRFSPARRYGAPVDVVVEVAVEFRLR